jgi:hypothetical protein
MSQYLRRIEDAIRADPDPYRRAESRALRALYLARLSRFTETQDEIDALRQDFGGGQCGRVTCLVMIAEGVKHHYQSFSPVAIDRLNRALFLGQAMRDSEVIALAAAWKGFLDFEYSRFDSTARTLALAIDSWSPGQHTAKTRVFLVLMLAAMVLGKAEATQTYFKKAHHHAVADGDQASIDALVFDRAVFSLSRQRVEWALGKDDPDGIARTRLELESSGNLTKLMNIETMADHVVLGRARADWMLGEFAAAASALEDFVGSKSFRPGQLNDSALRAELAYCHLLAGNTTRAQSCAASIDIDDLRALDPDERLVLSKMLLALEQAGLEFPGAMHRADFARDASNDHQQFERQLGEALAQLQARLPESTA